MSKYEISRIDAAFQKKLLEALALAHQEQINQTHSEAGKRRVDFLKKWHQGWIIQDLSAIIHKNKNS